MTEIDPNHRNAILESAALVAEQIDSCRDRQTQKQIAAAIRQLKVPAHRRPSMPLYPSEEGDMTGTT